jgi:homocysteine S-methyltransferase
VTRRFVTDGGLETDLIFHHGVDLPEFAAFPLVEDAAGRALLEDYYDGYAAIAAQVGAGLMLESATWRASADWGARLGYDPTALARVNRAAIEHLRELRARYAADVDEVVVSAMVGPRGDGYDGSSAMDADEAADYHRPQLEAFASAGADIASAYTLTHTGEAIGIVQAARDVGLPVAISFTVETDGRLPSGEGLGEAVLAVDAAAAPDYFQVNCAHPTHIARGLEGGRAWRERIHGVRPNASAKSHAELDESDELDEGDPAELAGSTARLVGELPRVTIVGGCCGTDARHVARMWASG